MKLRLAASLMKKLAFVKNKSAFSVKKLRVVKLKKNTGQGSKVSVLSAKPRKGVF